MARNSTAVHGMASMACSTDEDSCQNVRVHALSHVCMSGQVVALRIPTSFFGAFGPTDTRQGCRGVAHAHVVATYICDVMMVGDGQAHPYFFRPL